MEYTIFPVLMGGLIKEISPDYVKIHIHGRLGVITISPEYIICTEELKIGHELNFYFSYLRVTDEVFDVDLQGMHASEPFPTMIYGTITEVNDTAIKATLNNSIGSVAVPLRFVFTDVKLKPGLCVELYLSSMEVVGLREIPAETI